MSNIEPTREEMIKTIKEFAKTNPRDYEIIRLICSGYEGWAELSDGETVYINQPRKSGTEVGIALKGLLKRFDKLGTESLNELGIETKNKNMSEILEELSVKWNELK